MVFTASSSRRTFSSFISLSHALTGWGLEKDVCEIFDSLTPCCLSIVQVIPRASMSTLPSVLANHSHVAADKTCPAALAFTSPVLKNPGPRARRLCWLKQMTRHCLTSAPLHQRPPVHFASRCECSLSLSLSEHFIPAVRESKGYILCLHPRSARAFPFPKFLREKRSRMFVHSVYRKKTPTIPPFFLVPPFLSLKRHA